MKIERLMTRPAAFAALLAGALLIVACGGDNAPDAATGDGTAAAGENGGSSSAQITTFSTTGWSTDFSRHAVPFDEITGAGPPKDGIPAIDGPTFASFADADEWLAPDEPVMAVRIGDDARAYPLQILIWHEIVNDTLSGTPVVITYCPLCNTAIAFERTLDGAELDFGTTGNLRHSDLVMYDRQTESWWQQITGEGIVGAHTGKLLTPLPASIVSYDDFKEANPEGRVLSRDTGFSRSYGRNPYDGYDTSAPFLFSGPTDGRLSAVERVVSFILNDEAVAYPFKVLEEARVVNDSVGGEPVVVFFKPGTRSALDATNIAESRDIGAGVAFLRESGGQVLTFVSDGDGFVDNESGSRWNIAGEAVAGPLTGERLDAVVHGNHFWFAWSVFRPDTRVYHGS